jgi:hypothetical protein
MKVLLGGGWAAGRVVEVEETATSVGIPVPDYSVGPPHPEITHTYVPTGEEASGYPVWGVVVIMHHPVT